MNIVTEILKKQLKLYEINVKDLINEAKSICEICSLCTNGKK